jgi:UDP-N-acetylmuramate--alanine ligase
LLRHRGYEVSGSDREESPITIMLAVQGIATMIEHDADNVPPDCTMVIYSDAVPSTNAERIRAQEMGIPQMSYFEALGEVTKGSRTIAVAGTHGKTTVTGMLATILRDGRYEPTAIVGSVIKDFGSNFLAGKSDLFVVEACEYRDHLLKLSPEILVITNVELDHTDYFPDIESLVETFRKAAHAVPKHGCIITDPSGPHVAQVLAGVSARIVDYTHMAIGSVQLMGEFNRDNARAALAAAHAAFPQLSLEAGVSSLAHFKGAWRRFEYRGETPSGAQVYDDYAHHPTAMKKTILAAREKFPDKKIVLAFHPHLYSRTRSFLREFAEALALPDMAIVAPIYAAREAEDPTVSHQILANLASEFGGNVIALDSFEEIRDRLLQEDEISIIITMGAGDIYKVAEQIAD